MVGGATDNTNVGAAWVFKRANDGTWTTLQKLLGNDSVGLSRQGTSVALSADGNTALVGAPTDNSSRGAAWVYTRSGCICTQQGLKLNGSDAVAGSKRAAPRRRSANP